VVYYTRRGHRILHIPRFDLHAIFFCVDFDTHFSMTGFLAGLVPISSRTRGSIILILYSLPPSQPEKKLNNRSVSQSYRGPCLWVRFTLTLFLGYDEVRVSDLNCSHCLLLLSDIRMISTWTSSANKLSIKILMGSKGHPAWMPISPTAVRVQLTGPSSRQAPKCQGNNRHRTCLEYFEQWWSIVSICSQRLISCLYLLPIPKLIPPSYGLM